MAARSQIASAARTQAPRSVAAALYWLAVVCCIFFALSVGALGQSGQRLILKDGSWQEILQYEVKGDRTRYLSFTRHAWEELPTNLVDWPATERWNAQEHPAEDESQAGANDAAEPFALPPGLQLPSEGGVFILDTFYGEPSLVELNQTPGALNRSAGIFHSSAGPRAPGNQHLKIRGASARTHAHVALPQIFVKLSEPKEGSLTPAVRFRIARLQSDKGSRILTSIHTSLTGKQAKTEEFIPVRTERHEDWLRVVPAKELHPGEYALVEILDQNRFNSYVWDFSYDPKAPGNVNAHTPYSEATVDQQQRTNTPELTPRKK